MPLYRGSGGAGDASTDAYASQIAQYAQTATTKANVAPVSAAATAAGLYRTPAGGNRRPKQCFGQPVKNTTGIQLHCAAGPPAFRL